MKRRLKLIVPLAVLLLVGGMYKLVLAKPADHQAKVHGTVYVLPKEFLINLADGRFTKLSVALVLSPAAGEELAAHGAETAAPPEGFGALPQEALVRELVTDTLTDSSADELIARQGRERLKRKVLQKIHSETDVEAKKVVFTDVAVQ